MSLLCVISKVFEKVIYNRLLEFLETYKILTNSQFGFRKSHSTYMALMTLMDRLITSLENDEHVIGIFLDFSKAFDTVDHAILLKKMSHYGIRGKALKWFESYLSNRKQYVTYNGISSVTKIVKCGVPQGSILGPLLFIPPETKFRGGILDSPCSSVRLSVCLSVCPSVRPWVGVRMITLILFSGFKNFFLHISLGSRSCMGLNISVLPH